jgi:hypothetical protein
MISQYFGLFFDIFIVCSPKLDEVFRNDAGEREISLSDFLMQVNKNILKPEKKSIDSLKGKMPSIRKR